MSETHQTDPTPTAGPPRSRTVDLATRPRRRRITVGFVEVESNHSRWLAEASGIEITAERRRRPPRVARDDGTSLRSEGRWWCLADGMDRRLNTLRADDFAVERVYRTDRTVPEDARCEDCGISICDLQTQMTEAIQG